MRRNSSFNTGLFYCMTNGKAKGEFALIERYFQDHGRQRPDVKKGVGDDCAILAPQEAQELVMTTDTMVSGVHFLPNMSPKDIGHKLIASNLSDIAAMGAEPTWLTLALTLPEADEAWIDQFSQGLFELADYYGVELVGGDTTRGPLSLTITAMGAAPKGQALRRSAAKAGDHIYVTGSLGDAGLGLDILLGQRSAVGSMRDYLIKRHCRPMPQVLTGQLLRPYASACIDLSDGLGSDIRHILAASQVGAVIYLEQLPLSEAMTTLVNKEDAWRYALTGGEDYELCFTVEPSQKSKLETALASIGVPFTEIGKITSEAERLRYISDGESVEDVWQGYNHFAESESLKEQDKA